jgi:hypothetical protein
MRSFAMVMVLGASVVLNAVDASAAVLCTKKSGVVVLRTAACKKKETQIDPIALGLQGPQGIQGVQGLQGPGADSAVVAANGSVLAQSGGLTIAPFPAAGPGYYTIHAGKDVTGKTIQITTFATTSDGSFRGAPTYLICGTTPPGIDCTTLSLANDNQTIIVVTTDTTSSTAEAHGWTVAIF